MDTRDTRHKRHKHDFESSHRLQQRSHMHIDCPTHPSPLQLHPRPIPDPQPTALHTRLYHIAHLRTTHAHSVSTATTQAGRAGKAQNRSARIWAAWGCAHARTGGHYKRARQCYGSPEPESASSASLSATNGRRGQQRQPANAAQKPLGMHELIETTPSSAETTMPNAC